MRHHAYELRNDLVHVPESQLPPPVLSYHPVAEHWVLEEPYVYRHDGTELRIPEGFTFDLASVPRAFWWLIAPFELSIVAPLLHDFLYRYRGDPPRNTVVPPRTYTREEADLVFREAMRQEAVPGWRAALAYGVSRLFGGPSWGVHRAEDVPA